MFLSENVNMVSESVSADPTYGMQIIQEATDSYNDLCMKMIKLEHTAIVSEDAALLQEGVKEFSGKVKEWAKRTAQKFIEYLERVRVQWTKIQASVQTRFVNQNAIEIMKNKIKTAKYSVKLPEKKFEHALEVAQSFAQVSTVAVGLAQLRMASNYKSSALSVDEVVKQKIPAVNKFESMPETEADVPINAALVDKALKFLKQRPVAVKNIQVMKSETTKLANAVIKDADKNEKGSEKNSLIYFQRICNKMIIDLNKCTNYAVRICSALVKTNKEDYADAKKQARENGKNVREIKNESVLDQFA